MRTSFDALHDETRSLRLLEEQQPAKLPTGLTLLSAVLVLLPIALAFLL